MADRIRECKTKNGQVGVDLLRVKAVEDFTEERDNINTLKSGLVSLKETIRNTNIIFLDGHGFVVEDKYEDVFKQWKEVVLGSKGLAELTESEKGGGK